MDGDDSGLLARWFQLLATKGVDDLVFINRSWPPIGGLPLPSSLFSCASLCRLFIGAWVFPDTAALPRGAHGGRRTRAGQKGPHPVAERQLVVGEAEEHAPRPAACRAGVRR